MLSVSSTMTTCLPAAMNWSYVDVGRNEASAMAGWPAPPPTRSPSSVTASRRSCWSVAAGPVAVTRRITISLGCARIQSATSRA